MNAHHMITEEHIVEDRLCPYCSRSLEYMHFTSDMDFNYRSIKCECGRTVQVKVGPGSGHDNFNRQSKKRSGLDERLEKD